MNTETFNAVVDSVFDNCSMTLVKKAEEYAGPTDRLQNFKQAANLQQITVIEAIAGMMAKHTVSVYDMAFDRGPINLDLWNEKITDHINYLVLLRAALIEEVNADNGQLELPLFGELIEEDLREAEEEQRRAKQVEETDVIYDISEEKLEATRGRHRAMLDSTPWDQTFLPIPEVTSYNDIEKDIDIVGSVRFRRVENPHPLEDWNPLV